MPIGSTSIAFCVAIWAGGVELAGYETVTPKTSNPILESLLVSSTSTSTSSSSSTLLVLMEYYDVDTMPTQNGLTETEKSKNKSRLKFGEKKGKVLFPLSQSSCQSDLNCQPWLML